MGNKLKNDNYYNMVLKREEELSTDPNTKVGCILVNNDGKIISRGHNHMPLDLQELPWSNDKNRKWIDTKYPYVIHAELDAVLNCDYNDIPLFAYVSLYPCVNCVKTLAAFGIRQIIYREKRYIDSDEIIAADKLISILEANGEMTCRKMKLL